MVGTHLPSTGAWLTDVQVLGRVCRGKIVLRVKMRWVKVVNDAEIMIELERLVLHRLVHLLGAWPVGGACSLGRGRIMWFLASRWKGTSTHCSDSVASPLCVFALVCFQSYRSRRYCNMGPVACRCWLFVPELMQWVVSTFLMLNWALSQWVLDSTKTALSLWSCSLALSEIPTWEPQV